MTQSNPNRQRNDDVRREQTGVGVYDDNNHVDANATANTTLGTDGIHTRPVDLDRPYRDDRTMAEPVTYGTTEPARRAGSSIMSWIVIAIIAIVIFWLVFTFLF